MTENNKNSSSNQEVSDIGLISNHTIIYKSKEGSKDKYRQGKIDVNSKNGDFKITNEGKVHLSSSNGSGQDESTSTKNTYNKKITTLLNKFIGNNFNNIMALSGAGSSISGNLLKNNDCRTKLINENENVSKGVKKGTKFSGLTTCCLAYDINRYLINNPNYYSLVTMAYISRFYFVHGSDLNEQGYRKFKGNHNKEECDETYNDIIARCKSELSSINKKENFDKISEKAYLAFNNFESLLSNLNNFSDFIGIFYGVKDKENKRDKGSKDISTPNPEKYNSTIKRIHKLIREYCCLYFDPKYFAHADFIQELQYLNYNGRPKIYSTNYDTLFEQAAEYLKYLVIDGFNYRPNRLFNENSLNTDFVYRKNNSRKMSISNVKFYPNVVKIFQLHGSVDWYLNKKNHNVYKTSYSDVTRKINDSNDYKTCMIFPSSNKYQQSYKDPYFDLFLNFQRDLHRENTLLIVVGFSFGDKHIKRMVQDAMLANKSLSILFLSHGGVNDNSSHLNNNEINIKHNLQSFFKSNFLPRELFFKGDLLDFVQDVDLKQIYNS